MRRLLATPRVRRAASVTIGLAMVAAVVVQRHTIAEAFGHLRTLSGPVVAALVALAVTDRLLRAELIRSLLPQLSLIRAECVSDVGAAASKGLPAGGPVGTVLRWQIASGGGVEAVRFATMLIATGVATAFVTWTLPLVATVVDTRSRSTDLVDLSIIVVSLLVVTGSLGFWLIVLRSDAVHRWLVGRSWWIMGRLGRFVPALSETDPEAVLTRLRLELRRIGARPAPLLLRTTVAHLNGALILWLALQGLGVGPDLGAAEFARVFFVAHLIVSFAPTPGGIGLVEFGLSAALVAAGVDDGIAVAGVVIYRLATFVTPIVVGTVLYVLWQRSRRVDRRGAGPIPVSDSAAGRPVATPRPAPPA
ncbi:MAG: lysylphosphatidylglycerol synthase transmembrane domain-containing protein [Actinomycetota bacterium]